MNSFTSKKSVLFLLFCSFFAKTVPLFAIADLPNTDFTTTNGSVNATAYDASTDRLYIGGDFTRVGPYMGGGVPIDANGAALSRFPKIVGEVKAVVPDEAGGWYVGGRFVKVGSHFINNLVHIRPDFSVDPEWNPNPVGSSYDIIYSLLLNGSVLYVGGSFTTIGGASRSYLAALNAGTGLALPQWNPSLNRAVVSMLIHGDTLYIGGYFDHVGGEERAFLAALNANTGELRAWNPNPNAEVFSLAMNASKLYVGGSFTTIGGQAVERLAAFTLGSNNLVTSWNPNVNGSVYALAATDSTVYLGGGFSYVGSVRKYYLAALNASLGELISDWSPNPNNIVQTLYLTPSTLYAGGYFSNVQDERGIVISRNRLASWNILLGSRTLSSWDPHANNPVSAIVPSGAVVYVGGEFNFVGSQSGVAKNILAALDGTSGEPISAWNHSLSAGGSVSTLLLNQERLYVGGLFQHEGISRRQNLSVLQASSGALVPEWMPNPNNYVSALAIRENTLYAGGYFTNIGGEARRYLAALNLTTGVVVPAWNPDPDDAVHSLALNETTLYAGGRFQSIGNGSGGRITRGYGAAWNTADGGYTSWDPGTNNDIHALTSSGPVVYAGGEFSQVGGQAVLSLVALDSGMGAIQRDSTALSPRGDVYAVSIQGPNLYAGGLFTQVSDTLYTREGLMSVSLPSYALSAWSPRIAWLRTQTISIGPRSLYAGGLGGLLSFDLNGPSFNTGGAGGPSGSGGSGGSGGASGTGGTSGGSGGVSGVSGSSGSGGVSGTSGAGGGGPSPGVTSADSSGGCSCRVVRE